MLREIPDCESGDNPDYERWLDEVQRAEGEEGEQEGIAMKRQMTTNKKLFHRASFHLRHYGAAVYNPSRVEPVADRQWVKPTGGLWTSPVDATWGWKQRCEAEEFGDVSTWFDVQFTGNVLVIDCVCDLHKLPWCTLGYGHCFPLFQPLILMGIDAIHLTERGQQETRFSKPYNLYGWDCETVLVMTAECLRAA